jgi:hypothetical protein
MAVSTTSSDKLQYLDNVTSDIKSTIHGKEPKLALGATQFALINDTTGKVAVSTPPAEKLAFLNNVTSDINTMLGQKQNTLSAGDGISILNNVVTNSLPSKWSKKTGTDDIDIVYLDSGKVAINTDQIADNEKLRVFGNIGCTGNIDCLKLSTNSLESAGNQILTLNDYVGNNVAKRETTADYALDVGGIAQAEDFMFNGVRVSSPWTKTITNYVGNSWMNKLKTAYLLPDSSRMDVAVEIGQSNIHIVTDPFCSFQMSKNVNHPGSNMTFRTKGNMIFETKYTKTPSGNSYYPNSFLASNGRVGINTTTPSTALEVKGDLNVIGNLCFKDTVYNFNKKRSLVVEPPPQGTQIVEIDSVKNLLNDTGNSGYLYFADNKTDTDAQVKKISYNELEKIPTLVTSYNQLTNLPTLVTSYTQLANLPTLVTSYTQLTNLPNLATSYTQLTDLPSLVKSYTQLTDLPTLVTSYTQLSNLPTLVTSYTHIRMYVCMYLYVCMYIYVCMHVCMS